VLAEVERFFAAGAESAAETPVREDTVAVFPETALVCD
jgi:hypothetical protein